MLVLDLGVGFMSKISGLGLDAVRFGSGLGLVMRLWHDLASIALAFVAIDEPQVHNISPW